ncbi:MAG TPA: sigma-70 family RNA polymerase sigma factor [Rhizobiaceae bacterium]|nr:sigma-70 family RNA polymerase sigma factor [Rhizobiaceae bacterium]
MGNLTADEMTGLAGRVAQERDRQAFEILFDFFAPRINAYLRRLGLDPAGAEEICQEVMVTLWHKAAQYDPGKSTLSTWLFRIARNRRIDLARRDKSDAFDQDDPTLLPEGDPSPDSGIDSALREMKVREAMSQLPPEQYDVIRFAFFMGYPHSQIAEETGLPIGTVKSRIRLAFARLKVILEQDPAIDAN